MQEKQGDLWEYPAAYRCVTTNGEVISRGLNRFELVMGAGVAKDAKFRFPELPFKLGNWVLEYGNRAFICKEEKIITLPTKLDWRKKSIPELIERSLGQVVAIVNKFKVESVALSRPGCGNGGLDWRQIRPMCLRLLDDRFTVLHKGDAHV